MAEPSCMENEIRYILVSNKNHPSDIHDFPFQLTEYDKLQTFYPKDEAPVCRHQEDAPENKFRVRVFPRKTRKIRVQDEKPKVGVPIQLRFIYFLGKSTEKYKRKIYGTELQFGSSVWDGRH